MDKDDGCLICHCLIRNEMADSTPPRGRAWRVLPGEAGCDVRYNTAAVVARFEVRVRETEENLAQLGLVEICGQVAHGVGAEHTNILP